VIEVGASHGVRVQIDATEVHDPEELRGVAHDDLVGRSPRGKEIVTVSIQSGLLSGARFW